MTVLLAEQVEHVGCVARVEQSEAGGEAEHRRVLAHEVVGDGVKRPTEQASSSARHGHERAGALLHLPGCTAGEGQEQDPLRCDALAHEPRHAAAQRGRLPGAGTGEDQ